MPDAVAANDPVSLAQQVLAGTYVPSNLEKCDDQPPPDLSPQVIRLKQFILFADPKADIRSPGQPGYLIFRQFDGMSNNPPAKGTVDRLINPLASAILQSAAARIGPAAAPAQPLAPAPVAARPRTAAAARSASVGPAIPPQAVQLPLTALQRAGFSVEPALATAQPNQQTLIDALTQVFFPGPYQPFKDPHPHVALLATYEQLWEPTGYTRGELITTIDLAPGEQLTIEIHSWDKTAYKSQDELLTESELRVSETSNQRDSLTVARESASQSTTRLDLNAVIPIQPVAVNFGGGGVSQSITDNVKNTTDQSQQRTADAASTLKTSHKLNIEISREIGQEQKQTRVIANTNRCHSLTCQYFEIMANYLVRTRLASLEPCLLLPTPRADVTPAWTLCHEAVLKKALLDNVYLPGFDAARTLEAEAAYVEIQKIRGAVPSEFEPELGDLLAAIGAAYTELVNNFQAVTGLIQLALFFLSSWGIQGVVTYLASSVPGGLGMLQELLYYVLLAANKPALQPEPVRWLVALPTDGSVLQTVVGGCDACEDFIQQSRAMDLRMQDARTKQQESEAQRRAMLLATTPPNLNPFDPITAGSLTIKIDGQSSSGG